jgi:nitroreductase
MDVMKAIQSRRSIRAYNTRGVEKGKLMRILESGTAIAVDHMTLQAVEEGLGTCWIGAFDEKKVKEILHIPDNVRVVALLPVGYPCEIPDAKPRKSLDEIVMRERWSV